MRKIRYAVCGWLHCWPERRSRLDWHRPGSRFRCDLGTIRHLVMGRRTYEAASKRLGEAAFTGTTAIVFSRTMKQQDHPEVTVVSELNPDWVRTLQTRSGKDIWLFGGSELFRSFLDSGQVDTVEVNVIPVLLGGGVPLLPPPYNPAKLRLLSHKIYRSGRVSLAYQVQH